MVEKAGLENTRPQAIPNPDWIGAYWMPQDHEMMLTDEEERLRISAKKVAEAVNPPPAWQEAVIWAMFLTAFGGLGYLIFQITVWAIRQI